MSEIGVIPREADFFPACASVPQVTEAARAIQVGCLTAGLSRRTYVLALTQLVEAFTGVAADDDVPAEVLAFIADRLRASAEAADANARGDRSPSAIEQRGE
jgi:hypothetical protein